MSLQRFQLDVAARIEASAFFANVPVFVFRPRAALTAAQIQNNINAALGALTAQSGRAGLCATVLMPVLRTARQELPGPWFHLQCTIRVQENVMVNMGVNGIGIACEDAAIAVAQILHLWTPGGTAGILRAASDTITPNLQFEGKVTYDVLVESELEIECLDKEPQPFISVAEGVVTITCSDQRAAIYYTLDGTAPWAGNATYPSTAILYTEPFAAPEIGAILRAAALAPGALGSDINWKQF